MSITSLLPLSSFVTLMLVVFALVLLVILIVSFRSRAVVFCQYLEAMTGIHLSPADVRRAFDTSGRNGVRDMFLDLIIREDLKEGPMEIPEEGSAVTPANTEADAEKVAVAEDDPDRAAIN